MNDIFLTDSSRIVDVDFPFLQKRKKNAYCKYQPSVQASCGYKLPTLLRSLLDSSMVITVFIYNK